MPGLVDQYAWDLLCNVECFRTEHKLIDLFGDFLEERLPTASLAFFLLSKSLLPCGVSYDFSSRREMGASPENKSLPSIGMGRAAPVSPDRALHLPGKYLPYEMVPGETDRQVVFTAEQPYTGKAGSRMEWPRAHQVNTDLMSPAVCLAICKRLGKAYPCLDIEAFLEFIDTSAFERSPSASGQGSGGAGVMDMEAPVIPVDAFLHFAVHQHHEHGGDEPVPASPGVPGGGMSVPMPPPLARVDGTAARNEIARAVTLLRQEVERRVAQIAKLKEEDARERKNGSPSPKRVVEMSSLQEEVFTRLRMLGQLGLTDHQLEALQENHFVNYVKERAETWG